MTSETNTRPAKTKADANVLTALHNLYFSENKPESLQPLDISLAAYLILRKADDQFIFDSHDTLAQRLGCERRAIARSIRRLKNAGWVSTQIPYQYSEKTKRKTRVPRKTIGLSINLDKLPKIDDRTKRTSQPSEDAIWLAQLHDAFLIKNVPNRPRQHRDFKKHQQRAAQRLIDEIGDKELVIEVLNFAAGDSRFSQAMTTSLYEVRLRSKKILKAFTESKVQEAAESAA